jgi:hypothetical protein
MLTEHSPHQNVYSSQGYREHLHIRPYSETKNVLVSSKVFKSIEE